MVNLFLFSATLNFTYFSCLVVHGWPQKDKINENQRKTSENLPKNFSSQVIFSKWGKSEGLCPYLKIGKFGCFVFSLVFFFLVVSFPPTMAKVLFLVLLFSLVICTLCKSSYPWILSGCYLARKRKWKKRDENWETEKIGGTGRGEEGRKEY